MEGIITVCVCVCVCAYARACALCTAVKVKLKKVRLSHVYNCHGIFDISLSSSPYSGVKRVKIRKIIYKMFI